MKFQKKKKKIVDVTILFSVENISKKSVLALERKYFQNTNARRDTNNGATVLAWQIIHEESGDNPIAENFL